jgi:hypothetical protein
VVWLDFHRVLEHRKYQPGSPSDSAWSRFRFFFLCPSKLMIDERRLRS